MDAENELVRKHLQRPFSTLQRGWAMAGIGFCTVLLAGHEYLQPSAMPFTGKWGWFKELMHAHLGQHGVAVGTGFIGLLLLLWGGYDVAISKRSAGNGRAD
jgi:hypothetical protein